MKSLNLLPYFGLAVICFAPIPAGMGWKLLVLLFIILTLIYGVGLARSFFKGLAEFLKFKSTDKLVWLLGMGFLVLLNVLTWIMLFRTSNTLVVVPDITYFYLGATYLVLNLIYSPLFLMHSLTDPTLKYRSRDDLL